MWENKNITEWLTSHFVLTSVNNPRQGQRPRQAWEGAVHDILGGVEQFTARLEDRVRAVDDAHTETGCHRPTYKRDHLLKESAEIQYKLWTFILLIFAPLSAKRPIFADYGAPFDGFAN